MALWHMWVRKGQFFLLLVHWEHLWQKVALWNALSTIPHKPIWEVSPLFLYPLWVW